VTLLLTVLGIVTPVFVLAAIGFLWTWLGFEYRLQFVTRMAMTLALPALVFTALMDAGIDRAAVGRLALATLAAYAAITALVLVLCALMRLEFRTYLAPLIFANTGNIGLPLALFAFGEAGLAQAVIVFVVMAIYSFTAGVWMVAGGGSPLAALREPIVPAALLGLVFLWQGWQTPPVLTRTLELLGQMAIPLMLLTLGVAMARLRPAHILRAGALSVAKLAICAGAAATAGQWMQLEGTAFAVLVLQASTPVAVTSYLLAQKYGADADSVAGLVVVSTLVSVAALPALLAVLI